MKKTFKYTIITFVMLLSFSIMYPYTYIIENRSNTDFQVKVNQTGETQEQYIPSNQKGTFTFKKSLSLTSIKVATKKNTNGQWKYHSLPGYDVIGQVGNQTYAIGIPLNSNKIELLPVAS